MISILGFIIDIWWLLDICNVSIEGLNHILNDANGLNTVFWLIVLLAKGNLIENK